ncbi:sulfate transporter 2.1 isoform X2 [Arachis ipaensis]|uniref:sulfate transporter 2.1 isoform X2 n=1 Tax=Arachis ipaensis TaxID=130454 RepID=UPI000A2B2284|nr:sulfate transporter 2.1 isoform X2 [Arachis ipaensis]
MASSAMIPTCISSSKDMQVDIEKNQSHVRCQWVLNPPEPPSPWRMITDSVEKSILRWRKNFSTLGHESWARVMFSTLQRIFPILVWGRSYTATKFRKDLLAGLTIASLCIPQSIGYATLANLDPQYGLYTSVVPPLIYAVMGTSQEIAMGPVAVVSLLLSSMVQKLRDPVFDPIAYTKLVLLATLFAGIFQTAFGLFRLGFLVDFLSHAAIVGFVGGAAIVIGLQQLKGLLGVSHFTTKTDIISVIKAVWQATHHPESVAVGRSFASIKGYQLNGNKEMVSIGITNIIGSFTSCYVATGSFSRTAVNYAAGCETLVSNIVMGMTVLISLQFMTKLLYYTPTAILASVILSALPGLIDINEALRIWKLDKFDFLACLSAFFGVLFASVEIGLLVAVAVSFSKIIVISIRPGTETLGKLPGTDLFGDVNQYPMAVKIPGLLIIRLKSALLCFANATFVRERIMKWVSEEEESMDDKGNAISQIQFVILDMSNLVNIDTSGIAALEELHKSLSSHRKQLAIANPRWQVIHKLKVSNFVNKINGRVFLTVEEAVSSKIQC